MFQFRLRTLFAVTALVAVYAVALRQVGESWQNSLYLSVAFWPIVLAGFFVLDQIAQRWDGTHRRSHWPIVIGLYIILSGGMWGLWAGLLSDYFQPQSISLLFGSIGFFAGCLMMLPGVLIIGFIIVTISMCASRTILYSLVGILWGGIAGASTLTLRKFDDWMLVLILFAASFGFAMGLRLDALAKKKACGKLKSNMRSSRGA